MNNKIIVFASCFFLLISFVFLSYSENKQADMNDKKIWTIYFENPKDDSLNFVIENHSENSNFHYKILSNENPLKQGDVTAANGQKENVNVTIDGKSDKKITVVVSANEESKEIYKIF